MPATMAYGVAPPAYRLPGSTRVGTVRLQVADLARSLDWYGRVLGFELRERHERSAALGVPGTRWSRSSNFMSFPAPPRCRGADASGCTISRSSCPTAPRSARSSAISARSESARGCRITW